MVSSKSFKNLTPKNCADESHFKKDKKATKDLSPTSKLIQFKNKTFKTKAKQ